MKAKAKAKEVKRVMVSDDAIVVHGTDIVKPMKSPDDLAEFIRMVFEGNDGEPVNLYLVDTEGRMKPANFDSTLKSVISKAIAILK